MSFLDIRAKEDERGWREEQKSKAITAITSVVQTLAQPTAPNCLGNEDSLHLLVVKSESGFFLPFIPSIHSSTFKHPSLEALDWFQLICLFYLVPQS